MIPDMQAIQANLALGLITEREAEELYFLVALVDRDYLQSALGSIQVNPEITESKTEMEFLDGNCP